jgi:hypothetical protein
MSGEFEGKASKPNFVQMRALAPQLLKKFKLIY